MLDATHYAGSAHEAPILQVRKDMMGGVMEFPEVTGAVYMPKFEYAEWQRYAESIGYDICMGM